MFQRLDEYFSTSRFFFSVLFFLFFNFSLNPLIFFTRSKARLELLTQRLHASRQHQQQPPQQQPPQQLLPQLTPTNDSSIATYAAMQEMLRQQRLAISVAQQRRDDLKREIDRLSRQVETEAYFPAILCTRAKLNHVNTLSELRPSCNRL